MFTDKIVESSFQQTDNTRSFDRRTWAGHDEFVVPTKVYQSLKFGRDRHSKWNDHVEDLALKRDLQKVLYSTGKCLITCDTSGASTFISHRKMVKNLALTDDMVMSESARSFAVTAIFLAAAGIAGKIDCFASPALVGTKIPLRSGYVIQDTRAKAHYDKTVSVLVFNASKDVVGYIKPKDWEEHLQELVFADDITLLTSEIPGMEMQFENALMVFDSSLEFLKEGMEYEFTEEDTDYNEAFDAALERGYSEDLADLFAQVVLCFLKWYNNSDFDVEDSFEHAVDEIKSAALTIANNDLTDEVLFAVEEYIESSYSLSDELHSQAHIDANTDVGPSKEQQESGDYAKAEIEVHGMQIAIENPVGSVRSGVAADGTIWTNTMAANYGYFLNTNGADGDEVDVFVGQYLDSRNVWVINQVNKDQTFDEHKCMVGFNTENEAREAYAKSFDSNWKGFGGITKVPLDAFKSWVKDGIKESALNEAMKKSTLNLVEGGPSYIEEKLDHPWNNKIKQDGGWYILRHGDYYVAVGPAKTGKEGAKKQWKDIKMRDDYFVAQYSKERRDFLPLDESVDIVDQVFGSSLNESVSLYVGDDKDSATNTYFKDVCDRWKTSIIKASKKSKIVDWKVKDMFVASPSMLEMSFDYVNKEGKIEVLLYAADNGNAFDVHVTTLGKGGTRQPVIKGVRSFDKLVDDLEWFMLTVGV